MSPPQSPEALDAKIAAAQAAMASLEARCRRLGGYLPIAPDSTLATSLHYDAGPRYRALDQWARLHDAESELEGLLAERARVNLAALPADDGALLAEVDAAHAASQAAKRQYEDARGHAWRLSQQHRGVAGRRPEYVRQIATHDELAQRARASADQARAERRALKPHVARRDARAAQAAA